MSSTPGLVDIGGRCLRAQLHGDGPLLVLEAGTGRSGSHSWNFFLPELVSFATCLVYDRAGLGESDPVEGQRTADDMVADLARLLDALKLDQPAILVGTSLMGLMVQLFAARHPTRTAGLILLDPTPAETFEMTSHRLSRRPDPSKFKARPSGTPELALEAGRARESCQQLRAAEHLIPKVPAVVVSCGVRGDGEEGELAVKIMAERHTRLADLLGCPVVVATRSAHATLLQDEPGLVVEAIHNVVENVRRQAN